MSALNIFPKGRQYDCRLKRNSGDRRTHHTIEPQATNIFTHEEGPASVAGRGLGNHNGHGGYWGKVVEGGHDVERFSCCDNSEVDAVKPWTRFQAGERKLLLMLSAFFHQYTLSIRQERE